MGELKMAFANKNETNGRDQLVSSVIAKLKMLVDEMKRQNIPLSFANIGRGVTDGRNVKRIQNNDLSEITVAMLKRMDVQIPLKIDHIISGKPFKEFVLIKRNSGNDPQSQLTEMEAATFILNTLKPTVLKRLLEDQRNPMSVTDDRKDTGVVLVQALMDHYPEIDI